MSKLYDLLSAMCGKIKKPDWNQNDPTKPDYVKNRTHYDASQVLDTSNVVDAYDYNSEWGFAKVSNNPDDFVIHEDTEYFYINHNGGAEGRISEIGYVDDNLVMNINPDGSGATTIVAIVRSGDCSVKYGGYLYYLPALTPGIWVRRDPMYSTILYSVFSKDVHPIPEKYLPDSVKSLMVNIAESENEIGEPVYSADKTFEEIVAACEAGKDVYALYLNAKVPLTYRDSTTVEFSQAQHFFVDPVMLGLTVDFIAINVGGEVFLQKMGYPLASTRITPIIPPGIQPGQTVVVNALDDEGFPLEWVAVYVPSVISITDRMDYADAKTAYEKWKTGQAILMYNISNGLINGGSAYEAQIVSVTRNAADSSGTTCDLIFHYYRPDRNEFNTITIPYSS